MSVCGCLCTSLFSHTDFPPRSCALTAKVKEGASFFFWLWKMEASFMTHVPRPPVKITPTFPALQSASSSAQPMKTMERVEKKQSKQRGEKSFGRKYLQVYFIHIHHLFPSDSEVDPLLTHTRAENFKTHSPREVLMGFQWQSNLAIFQSSLQALCFSEGGLLGLAQQRCITTRTHHMWVDNWAQFCNSILRKKNCQATLPLL